MKIGYRLKMIREQRIGLLLLLLVIVGAEIFIHKDMLFSGRVEKEPLPLSVQKIIDSENETDSRAVRISYFNPNSYTEKDWQQIGFSEKQASVIIKYKNMLGGKFTSKAQLKKCFVISEDKYKELSSFIMLPEKGNEDAQFLTSTPLVKKYTLTSFNPNSYTSADWQKIGFTQKQAETILKYRNTIGGMFTTKEQLKKCFVISEDKYKELFPFIQLPEKSNKNEPTNSSIEARSAKYTLIKFNPNLYTSADWQKIGFSPKQAEVIIKYKNKLGGTFTSKQQIKECFVISEYKFKEIEPYIQF